MTTPPATARPTVTETDEAIEYFARKLRYETDPTDVAAALDAGEPFVLIDTRGDSSWHQGRARGAVHKPRAQIADRAPAELPAGTSVVVYCWGPACNGATRSAIEFLKLGYPVKEMIGGFEYWAREGLGVVGDLGPVDIPQDRLTSPVAENGLGEPGCDC
jgi:rhodanese-related sulfurtransferase